METLMAVVAGVLYAGGLYMMMRRSMVKLIIGLGPSQPRGKHSDILNGRPG